jgi:hypothetical protein
MWAEGPPGRASPRHGLAHWIKHPRRAFFGERLSLLGSTYGIALPQNLSYQYKLAEGKVRESRQFPGAADRTFVKTSTTAQCEGNVNANGRIGSRSAIGH